MKILGSAYSRADPEQVASNVTQLNNEWRNQLLSPLRYFEEFFDGTPGNWDTEPVFLELNPYYKIFHSRYSTVPIINKELFRKELKCLVKTELLTPVQKSQYGTPIFIIPNKKGTVRFITDYQRLNQKLVRNTYTLPIIGETMYQMKLFHYATALDINMGYNYIRLLTAIQDITTIVNEFSQFKSNCLPIGMCSLVDIFQAKLD